MIPFMGETVCRAFNLVFIPVFLLLSFLLNRFSLVALICLTCHVVLYDRNLVLFCFFGEGLFTAGLKVQVFVFVALFFTYTKFNF